MRTRIGCVLGFVISTGLVLATRGPGPHTFGHRTLAWTLLGAALALVGAIGLFVAVSKEVDAEARR